MNSPHPPYSPHSPAVTSTEHWIDLPQGRLYARSWLPDLAGAPERAAIVLFHDSLGSVDLWRDFPAQLAAATGRRVVAYDRLGFGRSSAHPGGWGVDFIAEEARHIFPNLRQDLGLERCIPYGYSVGGGMAANCAAFHPEACTALITQSAQAFVDEGVRQGIRQAETAFAQPGQRERLSKYHGDKTEWVLRAWIDTWLSEDFAPWRIDATAAAIPCPLLVMHGEQDEYGSLDHPRHIAGLASGPSELVVIKNCHHVPHREHPETVLRTVQRFLAGVA